MLTSATIKYVPKNFKTIYCHKTIRRPMKIFKRIVKEFKKQEKETGISFSYMEEYEFDEYYQEKILVGKFNIRRK